MNGSLLIQPSTVNIVGDSTMMLSNAFVSSNCDHCAVNEKNAHIYHSLEEDMAVSDHVSLQLHAGRDNKHCRVAQKLAEVFVNNIFIK